VDVFGTFNEFEETMLRHLCPSSLFFHETPQVKVLKPDTLGRADVLRVHARKHPIDPDVKWDQVARDLPGLSPAELANVLNEVRRLFPLDRLTKMDGN
jgi:hypothetical protein